MPRPPTRATPQPRPARQLSPAAAAVPRVRKGTGPQARTVAPTRVRADGRPRIQDVARAAAVSLGTVSAVLNGKGRLSKETRARVQAAIATLGYRPDLYASNLARRETQLLGLVVSSLQNPFFAETAQSVEDAAAAHGFQVSLMATNFSPARHRVAVEQMLGARVAGLAVITSEYEAASHARVLASGVPSVFLDLGKTTATSTVLRVDARGGMEAAVQHLIALGHRHLLFVRTAREPGAAPLRSHRLRHQGFQSAVRACSAPGLGAHVVEVQGSDAAAGERAIAKALGSVHFTAVLAVTDLMALGICHGLQSRGLRIPEDVSVVGFDDISLSRFLHPPLTTVDVPREELSRLAIAALLPGAARPRGSLTLPTRLVVRQSTAPPPR